MVRVLHWPIIQAGPMKEVLSPTHEPYTALLLAFVPNTDPGWLDGVPKSRTDRRRQVALPCRHP